MDKLVSNIDRAIWFESQMKWHLRRDGEWHKSQARWYKKQYKSMLTFPVIIGITFKKHAKSIVKNIMVTSPLMKRMAYHHD